MNDLQFSEQWALRNTGQSGGHYGADIKANGAWQTTTGSLDTVIAVIDSGIDFTHPDLKLLQKLHGALSEAYEKFFQTHKAILNGDLHQDTRLTLEDRGIAVTGAILGAILTKSPGGIVVGVGISLGATIIWRNARNVVVDEHTWGQMYGDLVRATNAAFNKLGIGGDQKGLAQRTRLIQIAENYNCGGMGGSW